MENKSTLPYETPTSRDSMTVSNVSDALTTVAVVAARTAASPNNFISCVCVCGYIYNGVNESKRYLCFFFGFFEILSGLDV